MKLVEIEGMEVSFQKNNVLLFYMVYRASNHLPKLPTSYASVDGLYTPRATAI